MYDQFDDRSRRVLYGFSKVVELPEFVKSAEEADVEDVSCLPSSCFADPVRRKYPVHTKSAAYLSRLYFTKNAEMYPDKATRNVVKNNLEKAAAFWALDKTYKVAEQTKTAGAYIPVVDYDGSELDRLPLNSPRDFEKAAIQIFESKNLFTYPQRRKIARTLLASELSKEAKVSEEVREYLEKAAGYGMSTREAVMEVLEKRAAAYGCSPELSSRMCKAAELIATEDITPSLLDKVASVIDVCDHALGFRRFYGETMGTPEEELFPFTEKVCSEIKDSYIRLHNGKTVSLEKLNEEKLNSFFDHHMGEVPEVGYQEKLDIVRSLPADDADALFRFVGD